MARLDDPHAPDVVYTLVSPGYFETMEIPILRGRNFTDQEARDSSNSDGNPKFADQESRKGAHVYNVPVIISETTASRFWPAEDAIGKRFVSGSRHGGRQVSSVVIGVAKDVRNMRLDRVDDMCLYYPVTRAFGGAGTSGPPSELIVLRARSDEARAVAAVQRVLQSTHSDLEAVVGDSRTAFTNQPWFVASRLGAIAFAIIAILGLLMASAGIHGTVGFAVTQRTQEIGIRMALGAQSMDVLGLVLSETMRPVAIGLTVGFGLAAIASRLMSAFLFGLSPIDPVAFLGAAGFMAAVALLAGYVPARRATKVDPMVALRCE